MLVPRPIRAVLFDAGHTLLEMDYECFAGYLRSRGHEQSDAVVVEAERRARMRLDVERASQPIPGRRGEGRYVKYLLEQLGIADEAERRAVAEWRRGFNVPVGLCHRPDCAAATALRRARDAGCVVGVISNSKGSVRRALEDAARTRAAETCYVGDSYFVDVVGARAAGLDAVLFDPGRVWDVRERAVAADLSAAVDQVIERVV